GWGGGGGGQEPHVGRGGGRGARRGSKAEGARPDGGFKKCSAMHVPSSRRWRGKWAPESAVMPSGTPPPPAQRAHTVLLTPQKNGSGPCVTPARLLRQA